MHEPHDEPESARQTRRLRGDRGVAAVEFAFIVPLLALFIFGIISFGLILSFKQDVTRAAAEGSRAGAVAFPAADAENDAWEATVEAVESFGRTCGPSSGVESSDGMTCTVVIDECDESPGRDCVTVALTYNYDDYPLIAKMPIMAGFLPDQIRASSVSRLND